ncbi:MAG: nucleotidyltransferase family protein [Terriglobales bacterium]
MSEVMIPTESSNRVSSMTPEDELCLLLARGPLTSELRTRALEFLATPLRWPMIMERARSHQVYPLVYRNLSDLDFSGVPEAVQSGLRSLYLANALRNQLLAEELARVLSLLGDGGIPVIPLKGVPLALSLFGDPAARVCGDIDILVPPADVTRAIDLILASGYRAEIDHPYFSKLALRHGRHFSVVREARGISFVLEVHWILVQHSSKNTAAVRDLWAEARPQTCFAVPASSLSPEWEFLYLCLHAADHDWQVLKWLVDIHQIVLAGTVDWRKAMDKAERLELGSVIRQTLAVCSLLLGTALPAECSPASLPERLRIFPQTPLPEDSPEATLAFRHLRVLTRPLDKLGYFATTVFAPKLADLELVRFPRYLGFLYYVIRPLRLAGKWARRALGLK